VGVFLADLNDFAEMNGIYKGFLKEPYPARTTVQAGLPPGMLIEVDCIALVPEE
jgi:2-iminobutanoate/2-iminopropanoate deaminase